MKFLREFLELICGIAIADMLKAIIQADPLLWKELLRILFYLPTQICQILGYLVGGILLFLRCMCFKSDLSRHPKLKPYTYAAWAICFVPVVFIHCCLILSLYVMATLADTPGGCIACSIIILADLIFFMRMAWPKKRLI